jgi:hypothetical protein
MLIAAAGQYQADTPQQRRHNLDAMNPLVIIHL